MLEALERRTLCAADPAIVRAVDRPAATAFRTTWVIVHGSDASPDLPLIDGLVDAVSSASSKDQTLVVDWQALAVTAGNPAQTMVDRAQTVADYVAFRLRSVGIAPARLNLIGHSLGALIAERVAANLAADGLGDVASLIALDPAAPKLLNSPSPYTPVNLKAHTGYAIAFHGDDRYSKSAPVTADDTVLLTGIGDPATAPALVHTNVVRAFTALTVANNTTPTAVSSLFSLKRIGTGQRPPWATNQYAAVYGGYIYEGVLSVDPATLAPTRLTYLSTVLGRTKRVFA